MVWELLPAHPHFRASMSFPGVSRHLRIWLACCLTIPSASSSRRPWSSAVGADAISFIVLSVGRTPVAPSPAASESMVKCRDGQDEERSMVRKVARVCLGTCMKVDLCIRGKYHESELRLSRQRRNRRAGSHALAPAGHSSSVTGHYEGEVFKKMY